MADEKSRSPERELLDLIEEGHDPALSTFSKGRKAVSLFSLGNLKGRVSFLKAKLEKGFSFKNLNLSVINGFLVLVLLVLFVYAVIEISLSIANLNSNLEAAFLIDLPQPKLVSKEDTILKSQEHYLTKANKRSIFTFVKKEKDVLLDEAPKIKEIVKKAEHLKLVGISWSQEPDAMIEDTRTNKTFFVKKGDMIGVIKVEDILMEKIILGYKDETLELE